MFVFLLPKFIFASLHHFKLNALTLTLTLTTIPQLLKPFQESSLSLVLWFLSFSMWLSEGGFTDEQAKSLHKTMRKINIFMVDKNLQYLQNLNISFDAFYSYIVGFADEDKKKPC